VFNDYFKHVGFIRFILSFISVYVMFMLNKDNQSNHPLILPTGKDIKKVSFMNEKLPMKKNFSRRLSVTYIC